MAQENRGQRDLTANGLEKQSTVPNDLPDNPHDEARLKGEETTMNLPDVEDIPGQAGVAPLPLGELADTTASSADEEGESIFGAENRFNDADDDADVTEDEKRALSNTETMQSEEDQRIITGSMDDTDFQGDKLNEKSFGEEMSGADLDIPGSDDAMSKGDEENKYFSLGGDDKEDVDNGRTDFDSEK